MKKVNFFLLSFLFYLIYALFSTYPLILKLDHFPGSYPGDIFEYAWNIYSFWNNILKFENPFLTKIIFYPLGTSLIFHTYSPLISLFGLFFLKNLIVYLNLILLLSLAFSALSAEFLFLYLTKNSLASFLAGMIYGFSPIMFSFYESQHYLYLPAAIFLPLGIFLIFKFFHSYQKHWLYFAILNFWLSFFTDYYSTVLLLICTFITGAIFILGLLRQKKLFLFFKNLTPSFLVKLSVLILIPFFLLFLFSGINLKQISFFGKTKNLWMASSCNTKPLGFFLPNLHNPLLGSFTQNLDLNLSFSGDTPSYFIGWFIPLFIIISLPKIYHRQETIIALTNFIFIFLLSLGSKVSFGKFALTDNLTPFGLLAHLPFLGLIDCPIRFPIASQLFLAILAALGLDWLTKKETLKKKIVIFFLFFFLFFVEYGFVNLLLSKASFPLVYQKLALINNQKTLLELPSGLTESKGYFGYDFSIAGLHELQMFWQTIHHKKRIGGYLSRISPEIYQFFQNEPVISDLFKMTNFNGSLPTNSYSNKEISDFIKKFNLGFIILLPNQRQAEFEKIIDQWFNDFIQEKLKEEDFIFYILK